MICISRAKLPRKGLLLAGAVGALTIAVQRRRASCFIHLLASAGTPWSGCTWVSTVSEAGIGLKLVL